MMKRLMLLSFVALIFGFASHALAQGFVPLAEIPGLTSSEVTSVISQNNFASFFNNLYKYVIGLSAALAVIMIIWGGLEISTQDSVSKQSKGRERITQAIYGLILVLAPVLVFSIINPSILRLDIGIKPLNTVTGAPIPVSTANPFVNVGTNSASDQVQVQDKIINNFTPGNINSIKAYQAAIAAAKAECENPPPAGAGGKLTSSNNNDGTLTLRCTIPVN